jgi:ArsR family transcriptional regulator
MAKKLALLGASSAECCPAITSVDPMSDQQARDLADRLKAVADPTRLRLLQFIMSSNNQEACTCDLAPAVGLSEPTVSHHLKKLEFAGLVTKERRGMSVYYSVIPSALDALAQTFHIR